MFTKTGALYAIITLMIVIYGSPILGAYIGYIFDDREPDPNSEE